MNIFYRVLLVLTALMVVSGVFAQDLSQTQYTAVRINYELNPADENVEWYIIEYNDEGLNDDTYAFLENGGRGNSGETSSSVTIPFTKLVELNGSRVTLDTEVCIRIIAARDTERSNPSPPACFTLRGPADTGGGNTPTVLPLSAPTTPATVLIP
jgi:hypothetical protein